MTSSGTYNVYLLDPDYSPKIIRDKNGNPTLITDNTNENIPSDTQVWSVEISETLGKNGTSYLCTVHKAPKLEQPNYLIGVLKFYFQQFATNSLVQSR